MAAKNAIPTIDLSPLRGGSGTEKREVARQIDAACTEIGFFQSGHQPRYVGQLRFYEYTPCRLIPRRNLDQLGEFLLCERRGDELQIDRLGHDQINSHNLVW
jgi:hypothetical protein